MGSSSVSAAAHGAWRPAAAPPAGFAAQVCAALFRSRHRSRRAATAEKKWSILGEVADVLATGCSFLSERDVSYLVRLVVRPPVRPVGLRRFAAGDARPCHLVGVEDLVEPLLAQHLVAQD